MRCDRLRLWHRRPKQPCHRLQAGSPCWLPAGGLRPLCRRSKHPPEFKMLLVYILLKAASILLCAGTQLPFVGGAPLRAFFHAVANLLHG